MIILMNMKEFTGLTHQQVQEKIAQGLTNDFTANTSTSTWQIIKRNVFTLFNALNFAIALALVAVQAWSNLVFFAVICFNALSGIVTELRAKHMVDKLNLLNKEKITVIRDGKSSQINPEDLVLDDCIQLATGEQIPSDATVLDGFAEVNEAMLTGESDLVQKEIGEQLLSGSFLASGRVIAKITHVGSDNYASKLMLEAKTVKPINSRIMKSMDRIAGFTGKIIIPFGIALFLEALFVKHLPVKDSVVNTSTALLGMLPKGIALLTITSLLTAVIKLGLRKVLVQEMYSVETLARVDMLCLDKTGTITSGHPEVVEETWADGVSPEGLMPLFVAMEQQSTHPLAAAIVAHAALPEDLVLPSLDGVETFVGKGVEAYSEGVCYRIGNAAFVGATPHPEAEGSEVFFSREGQVVARLLVADRVTEESREAVADLRKRGIEVVLLTGDNHGAAQTAAQAAGIEEWHAALLPHEKLEIVAKARAKGAVVAMVGDGINDSEALGEADVSLAFASGSDIAVSVADITLAQNDLRLLPQAIEIAKRSLRTIHANFFWALLYNFIAIPLAAGALYSAWGILLSPAISGAAMAFSSLSVVTNSLLLKRRLRREK